MTTTVRQIVNDALRDINVCEADDTPEVEEASDALRTLNRMMAAWPAVNIFPTLPPDTSGVEAPYTHTGLDFPDDWPLAEMFVDGITAMLSVRLAPRYGEPISRAVQMVADQGLSALKSKFFKVPKLTVDSALLRNGRTNFTTLGS